MTVRSRRLWGPSVVAAGATTILYTVPSGRTAIVRGYQLINSGGVLTRLYWSVNGTGVNQEFANTSNIAAGDGLFATPGWILNPGDVLRVRNTAAPITIMGWGVLLLGSPS